MPTVAKRTKTKKASSRKAVRSVSKTASKPAGAASKNGAKAVKSGRRLSRQGSAILVFFAALLLASIIIIPGEHVWKFIHELFFGLFGVCAYIFPAIMIYISIVAAFEKPVQSMTAKLFEMLGLVVIVDAAIQIFTVGGLPEDGFGVLYEGGIDLVTGGVAGGLIGVPLNTLFGKVGAAITVILIGLVLIMLLCEITLVKLINSAVKLSKKRKSDDDMPDEPKSAKFKHKKPRFNIDVPLGSDVSAKQNTAGKDVKNDADAQSDGEEKSAELDALVNKAAQTSLSEAAPTQAVVEEKRTVDVPESDGEQQQMYSYPPFSLLNPVKQLPNEDVSEELKGNAARLVDTLRSFGVETRITDICRGPAVTRYELQPSAGVKISRITALSDDIALNLASAGVRIEAPIPNKSAVGIEVPNKNVSVVQFREVIDSEEFRTAQSKLTMALGRDIAGNIIVADISKMPHMLIAGATGSGKSVCINTIIMSILYKATPSEVKFLMVDPKVVELGIYNGIPHLLVPVVTEPAKAAGALNWAVQEMLTRYKSFAENNVRDIKGYNKLAESSDQLKKMPHIVIIIDELSDLMMAAPKDVENAICRLAQMARAAGMHLVIATQRPSVDVITGVIKANIPSRIAFAVSSQIDSRTILDMGGAEKLLGRGDMLFLPMGEAKPVRVQGCFVTDGEVDAVTEYIKNNGSSSYDEEIISEIEKNAVKGKDTVENSNDDADVMLSQAIECVVEAGSASTSFLQRRLKLGYARAARIIDQMEQRGIVGPSEGSKPRQVLITRQQLNEMSANSSDETT